MIAIGAMRLRVPPHEAPSANTVRALSPASRRRSAPGFKTMLNTALPQVYEDAAAVDHAMVQKHAPVGGAGYTPDAIAKVRWSTSALISYLSAAV